jgi:hypothetical protein
MQAIELETEIDENHEIHLKLPPEIRAGKARVVVLYEPSDHPDEAGQREERRPLRLGLYRGRIRMSEDFDDPLPDAFWLGDTP